MTSCVQYCTTWEAVCSTKTATGRPRPRRRSCVRRPCTGRRRSSSQVQVTYISLQIRSSVPIYLLISHTGYDPATAFGHTGMFRGTAPVGGPYPGMVPGPLLTFTNAPDLYTTSARFVVAFPLE